MNSGRWYRIAGVGGTIVLTLAAVLAANLPPLQMALTSYVPVLNQLEPRVLTNGRLPVVVATTLVVVLAALFPLYKPRPRRILDTIGLTARRVVLAGFALATIGYADLSLRLPRPTLILTVGTLLVAMPVWFVAIRRTPESSERVVVVGDDPEQFETVLQATEVSPLAFVSPSWNNGAGPDTNSVQGVTDGGTARFPPESAAQITGLSRLEDVIVDRDVDTAILAFSHPDRGEFFGVLDTCHEHGVDVKVLREHASTVLLGEEGVGSELFVDIDLEPWDWQDRLLKRVFDVAFSLGGLVVLSPVILVVAVAIKLDSPGPVLYAQERTAELGDTFEVYKFRSMVPDAESETGAKLSEEDAGGVDPRVTRVGHVLRRTHLDEIPQLWSILVGDMSVVGPRPERPELDADIGQGVGNWPQRWFVKPGLTGLAQINDVTGVEPEKKLRYDLEYIRRQSFWFDVKIVVRQIWKVLGDVVNLAR